MGIFDDALLAGPMGFSRDPLQGCGLGSPIYQQYCESLQRQQTEFNLNPQFDAEECVRKYGGEYKTKDIKPKGETYEGECSVVEKSFLPEIVEDKSFLVEFKREEK